MKRIILAALVGVLVSGPAWAAEGLTIGEALKTYDDLSAKHQKGYKQISGLMGEGLLTANAKLIFSKRPEFFCVPDNLHITDDQYFDIFRRYAEGNKAALAYSVGANAAVLLNGLIETFPCK